MPWYAYTRLDGVPKGGVVDKLIYDTARFSAHTARMELLAGLGGGDNVDFAYVNCWQYLRSLFPRFVSHPDDCLTPRRHEAWSYIAPRHTMTEGRGRPALLGVLDDLAPVVVGAPASHTKELAIHGGATSKFHALQSKGSIEYNA